MARWPGQARPAGMLESGWHAALRRQAQARKIRLDIGKRGALFFSRKRVNDYWQCDRALAQCGRLRLVRTETRGDG